MTNIQSPNSSVYGYLAPTNVVLDDDALDDFIHDLIQGLTNIDNAYVRPSWQTIPANMPDIATNWVSFGIISRKDDLIPSKTWDAITGETSYRNQTLNIQLSFFGPLASTNQGKFRDGINITQNRSELRKNGIAFVKMSDPMNANLLINERWQKRQDVILTLRREIERNYAIKDILSAEVILNTDTTSETIIINR